MAHYLIVTEDNPTHALRVEARHIKEAIESLGLDDGDSVTVYRIIGEPRVASVRTRTVRDIEID